MANEFDIKGDSPTWNDESVVDLLEQYINAGFNTTSPSGTANQEFRTVRAYLQQIYGPLPEGAVDYKASDLNGDKTNEVYAVDANGNPHTVYSYDDNNDVVSTSYEDFKATNTTATDGETEDEDPALTELISQYGEEAVEDLQNKYEELKDFVGTIPEDPVGTLKKMAEIFIDGTTGIPPECQSGVPGGPTGPWYEKCITVGVLIDIGFPGLPPGMGGIFKGATIGEIKEIVLLVNPTITESIVVNLFILSHSLVRLPG